MSWQTNPLTAMSTRPPWPIFPYFTSWKSTRGLTHLSPRLYTRVHGVCLCVRARARYFLHAADFIWQVWKAVHKYAFDDMYTRKQESTRRICINLFANCLASPRANCAVSLFLSMAAVTYFTTEYHLFVLYHYLTYSVTDLCVLSSF